MTDSMDLRPNWYREHENAVQTALAPHEGKWSILVYCDDESHEKHWDIAEFRITTNPYSSDGLSFWMYHQRGRKRQRRGESVLNINQQHLAGDRYMSQPRQFGISVSQADVRYPLKCKCGESLPWRRANIRADDRLQIELDKLAIVGASRIALSALRRIVVSP